jgi:hypothetical protein
MKNLLILLLTTFALSCCNKDDDPQPVSELDKLPPATQTGANTFGCLLDGVAFLPDNLPNSTNYFYQLTGGNYYFVIGASNYKNNDLNIIRLRTEKKQIFQGQTYDLFEWVDGNAIGNYTKNNVELYTSHLNSGKLTITKLDESNKIASGTFWFDVKDGNGIIHQIRDGRFDVQYTN